MNTSLITGIGGQLICPPSMRPASPGGMRAALGQDRWSAPRRSPPMRSCRVVIDAEKLRRINCGLGRFSLHLAHGMLEEMSGRIEPILLLPRDGERYLGSRTIRTIRVRPWRKEFIRRWIRPVVAPLAGRAAFDLWHMTNQMSRYEPLDPRVPMLLTIHDLTFLHEAPHEGRIREIERKRADIQRRVDRSAAITVDSRFVAEDLRRELDVGGRPIHVIPLGLPTATQAAGRPAFLPDGPPFLLSVGNAFMHKNFHVLVHLLEQLPHRRLVIAGNMQTDYGGHLHRLVSRHGLAGRVVLPGEVSDADRQWLYEHCEAFLFPSLSEGFGFPVLEAMHAGRPVFVTRLTSLPEIAGEHGFYFDSFAPEAMAATLADGLSRFEANPLRAVAAKAHAASFSWQRTVSRFIDLYEQVSCGGRG